MVEEQASRSGRSGSTRLHSAASRITAFYLLFGTGWILLSDTVVGWLVPDAGDILGWSMTKGMLFVAATAVLLWVLVRRTFGALERANESLAAQTARLRLHQRELDTLVGSALDAIVTVDRDGVVTLANPAAERMFQGAVGAAIGEPVTDLLEGDLGPTDTSPRALVGKRANGETFPVEASIADSDVAGVASRTFIVRDVSATRMREAEIQRLSRLISALSGVNKAIVRSSSREELEQTVCRVLVEQGGLLTAWVGWHDPLELRIVPAAVWGDHQEYVRGLRIYSDERPEGSGPLGSAFRRGRPYVCNDLYGDPATQPWLEEVQAHGLRAGAALPIGAAGEVVGLLVVYAGELGFFQEREVELLVEAADDFAFALENFARERERQRAEAEAATERRFSNTMIECTPAILYIYDENLKLLRWNRNFELVTGYSAEETAGMSPLDFFVEADRPLIRAKISEVFAAGAAEVDAPLRAKDGSLTPYHFTGRRVRFDGRDCLVGMGLDLSERRRAEQELAASEARFRTLLDGLPIACQLIDHDWRYLYLNEPAARINRRPNAELLGRTVMECWPQVESTEAFDLVRRSLQRRVPVRGEVGFAFPDGSGGRFDVSCLPMPAGVLLLTIEVEVGSFASAALAAQEA